MGRNAAWLSEKQLEVLAWIRDGCPSVDQDVGYHRRISARALARRGLVKVKGQGATWRATITPAGATRLDAPPRPVSDQDRVDGLFRRVLAAGGRLEVDDREVRRLYAGEVTKLSQRTPDRPKGWRLTMRTLGPYDERRTELALDRYFADDIVEEPVPIPESVTRYHPAVKAYLADRDHQFVSKPHLARAARILQALADEAARRGLTVLDVGQRSANDPYRVLDKRHWHLILESPAGAYGLRISELSAPGGKAIPRRLWGERRTRAAWLDWRDHEFISTGVLELVVDGPGMTHGGARQRDAKTIPLEEKLPRVFRRIEVHRLESEHREEERRREAAERQGRWEAAMAEARAHYDEEARWEALRDGRPRVGAGRRAACVHRGCPSCAGRFRRPAARRPPRAPGLCGRPPRRARSDGAPGADPARGPRAEARRPQAVPPWVEPSRAGVVEMSRRREPHLSRVVEDLDVVGPLPAVTSRSGATSVVMAIADRSVAMTRRVACQPRSSLADGNILAAPPEAEGLGLRHRRSRGTAGPRLG